MPESNNDPRETQRHGENGQKGGAHVSGQMGQGQQGQSQQQGQAGMQTADDLKRRARNSEVDEQIRNAGREVAERFADRSREQIDRYERAFGEFWKVAESDGFMPFARSIARANMEFAGLTSRRAKAYAEFPVQMSQCQSTNEMLNRQMRFVSDLVSDYQETLGRMTRAWVETANPQQMMQQFGEMQGFEGGQGQQSHQGQQYGQQPSGQQQGQHNPGQYQGQYQGGQNPGQQRQR